MNKVASILADPSSRGSWARLFTPWSALTEGDPDRYPAFMKGVTSSEWGDWMLSKIGAQLLLGFAVAGGVRGARKFLRGLGENDKEDPTYHMHQQMSGVLEPDVALDKEASEKSGSGVVYDSNAASWGPTKELALPLLALATGAFAGWTFAGDEINDARLTDVKEMVADKHSKLWQLVQARAKLARGNLTEDEYKKLSASPAAAGSIIKMGGLSKRAESDDLKALRQQPTNRRSNTEAAGQVISTGVGMLLLAVAALSTIGSYTYFSASSDANRNYKSIKKGITNYARQRALKRPVTVNYQGLDAFANNIEGKKPQPAEVLSAPQVSEVRTAPEAIEAGNGISVTL